MIFIHFKHFDVSMVSMLIRPECLKKISGKENSFWLSVFVLNVHKYMSDHNWNCCNHKGMKCLKLGVSEIYNLSCIDLFCNSIFQVPTETLYLAHIHSMVCHLMIPVLKAAKIIPAKSSPNSTYNRSSHEIMIWCLRFASLVWWKKRAAFTYTSLVHPSIIYTA